MGLSGIEPQGVTIDGDPKKGLLRGILDRIREVEGLNSDVDVARLLGSKIRNISAWKQRETIPWNYLIPYSRRRGFSLEWLVYGNGPRRAVDMGMEPGAIFHVRTDQDAVYVIAAMMHQVLKEGGIDASRERFGEVLRLLHRAQLSEPERPLSYIQVSETVRLALSKGE